MRILLEYNKSRSHNTIHATGKARATASSEAVVLTVAVVGPPIRGTVESASTVVTVRVVISCWSLKISLSVVLAMNENTGWKICWGPV